MTTKKTSAAAAATKGGGGGNSRKRGAAPEALQRMAFLLKAASLAAEQANSGMRLEKSFLEEIVCLFIDVFP